MSVTPFPGTPNHFAGALVARKKTVGMSRGRRENKASIEFHRGRPEP